MTDTPVKEEEQFIQTTIQCQWNTVVELALKISYESKVIQIAQHWRTLKARFDTNVNV